MSMSQQLRAATEGVNSAAASTAGDPSQPAGKLVRILNNQLLALTHLETRTDELTSKVQELSTGEATALLLLSAEKAVHWHRIAEHEKRKVNVQVAEPRMASDRASAALLSNKGTAITESPP